MTAARAADADALHELLCVPEVYRYLADGAPPPRAVTEAWLKKSAADFQSHGVGLWLLWACSKKGGGPLSSKRALTPFLAGCVLLEVLHNKTQAELTYVLHPDHWGKGLATRMAWTAIQHAFENGLDAVIAGADAPNTASLAVMQRLGMQFHRTVQYPAGEGAEYILRSTDPVPERVPAILPFVR